MNKGFISIPIVIIILITSLASGVVVYYQAQRSKEKTETTPLPSSFIGLDYISSTSSSEQPKASSKHTPSQVQSGLERIPSVLSSEQPRASNKYTPPQAQSQGPQLGSITHETNTLNNIQQRFVVLESELQNAQEKKMFFSPEHAARILGDLTNLEAQGYSKSEVERLRKIVYDLSPHLQNQAKQNQIAPSTYVSAAQVNCKSNPSPIFTNDITDMSKVNYIGPPPTMGAGPSLKTHSYIGTDHIRVPVFAPAAMTLESGSHSVGGPYMMEFRVSCEVKVRFGHITEPIEAIKKLLPAEPKQDSRTEELTPIIFAAGDIVGYTIGTNVAGNWDFGVYNSTVRNRYADDLNWNNSTTYTTAVCPFDYFTASLRSTYFSKFNSAALGGNPPHGEPFCKI